MEKCSICGEGASRRFIMPKGVEDVLEIPVCDRCYSTYDPRPTRKGLEFKHARKVYHSYFILWFIESRSIAKLIERFGKVFGKAVSYISAISIPLTLFTLFLVVYLVIDRVIRPDYYFRYAASLPKGFMATGIPGFDPAVPFLQGWIAVAVLLVVHEVGHGLASTYLGTPPRKAGIILLLGLPIGAYVKIDKNLFEKGSWRFIGAGVSMNIVTAFIALALFIACGVPEQYTRNPVLFLLPPSLYGQASISFIQSLLLWIWFINLWIGFFNLLPIPGLDGYYIFTSLISTLLSKLTSKVDSKTDRKWASRIAFATGFTILSAVAIILLVERVIIPYL